MTGRQIISGFVIVIFIVLSVSVAEAETKLGDPVIYEISVDVFGNNFAPALEATNSIKINEPENPLGYFLTGAIYQIISEKFRNDSFKDQITDNLDEAIDLCNDLKDDDPENPDWYFIAGASYGYRGLHRALHGGWWGAFRDGVHCKSNLIKTLKLDSTYYDAYLGLGSYYYYRTIKSKDFLWLPFISDNREKGMAQVKLAIDNGSLAPNIARQSFLRIYFIEKRYDDLVSLADSLYNIDSNDVYTLLYYIEGLIALDSLEQARAKLSRLENTWDNSVYRDSIGIYEAECLAAKIAYYDNNDDMVRKYTEPILAHKDWCDENAYFEETYKTAKWLVKHIK
jgi:hypothetical protein